MMDTPARTEAPTHDPGAVAEERGAAADTVGVGEQACLQDLFRGFPEHRERPAVIAFHDEDYERLSYAELHDRALRVAAGLRARGAGPKEPVAVVAPNSIEAVVARLAILAAGGVIVSLDHQLDRETLGRQITDSGARIMFTVAELADAIRELGGEAGEIYVFDRDGNDRPKVAYWRSLFNDAPVDPYWSSPDDVAALFYTSGTTGPPKAVPLSHRNIVTNVRAILAQGLIGVGDRALLPLPLHHSYPFIVGMLIPLTVGASVVLPGGISGPQIVQALREGDVKIIVGVPRLYAALLRGIDARVRGHGLLAWMAFRALSDVSLAIRRRLGFRIGRSLLKRVHRDFAPRLRVLASGGAKLEEEVAWRLEGLGWEVLTGYGLVETASVATFNPRGRARIGTAGLPTPGVDVKIDRPDEEGRGEILVRGPIVFEGYRDNPEANREAFTDEGWFRTGDLGVRDEDGYVSVVGRVKEMIVTPGGKNVAPEEIEKAYAEHEDLREFAVLERDGRIVALVVPALAEVGQLGRGQIERRIRVAVEEQSRKLPSFQRISDFAMTREPLPRTHLGKYQRHKLSEIYERASRGEPPPARDLSPADESLLQGSRAAALWDLLRKRTPDRPLSPDNNPQLDLDIDSLEWVNITMEVEDRIGVRLSEEAIGRAASVRDLLEEVERAPRVDASKGEDGASDRAQLLKDRDRWLGDPGLVHTVFGFIAYGLVAAVVRLAFRLRVRDRGRVPSKGPLIVAANHASDLDPFVLAAALSYRRLRHTYWGADFQRVFSTRAGRWLARVAHLFPVADWAPRESLETAVEILRRGRILVWFPEEWRSPTGELQPFLPGIGRIARESGAAVVPAYIRGSFDALPRHRRWPRLSRIGVYFGKPVPLERLEVLGEDGDEHARIANALRDAVGALEREHDGGAVERNQIRR